MSKEEEAQNTILGMLKETSQSRQKHDLVLKLDLWEIEALIKFCKEQNIGVRLF